MFEGGTGMKKEEVDRAGRISSAIATTEAVGESSQLPHNGHEPGKVLGTELAVLEIGACKISAAEAITGEQSMHKGRSPS